ncbi:TetR/AcrR family transcriptional regulator [Quadrisphaera sp. DSM 44207]|uniref:TetR/AcrR family transcriptional regulator n=1 Tax=Quadrisphaera sp. DSM 44207 TaxID=1881057 RepID=UPI00088B23F1|nr:TetR family transcriptional regulator [Quadrisphaera sp. DSM 44207]SDQ21448.1 transcriptional regulator, TetR family [Quadrisphaera sp. DSM 44207]
MVRDAAATRARILRAAVDEFAAHGLAGGRVDRIARAAGANVRSLYVYYGNKERLFHAAVTEALHALGEEVPVTPEDLAGFAGRTFDWLLAHPDAVRLSRWRFLEAPDAGPDDTGVYADLTARMMEDPARSPHALPAADVLVLVHGMAAAWVSTSRDLLSADGRDPQDPVRVADHRAALVEAVRRLGAPPATG